MERENLLSLEQQAKLEELKKRWWEEKSSLEDYTEIFRDAERAGVMRQLSEYLLKETLSSEFE